MTNSITRSSNAPLRRLHQLPTVNARTTWLLTGGAGYIGSHVVHALLDAGQRVVVLDDLSTGDAARVPDDVPLVVGSVADASAVQRVLREHRIGGVIHLAAKKAVAESCAEPLRYYRENVCGLLTLLEALQAERVTRLVFSSSAAVYGTPDTSTVEETVATRPESPYGRTKLVGEWMVRDAAAAYGISVVCLRYFNVVGTARPELADGTGTNLFPQILRHLGLRAPVTVFGGDYPTEDGTCVRDYVHVADLAEAHVAAAALTQAEGCDEVVNVGTGQGYSVLDVLTAFGRAAGQPVPHVIVDRRPGDPVTMIADAGRAAAVLQWRARFGLADMVNSTWASAQPPATAVAGH